MDVVGKANRTWLAVCLDGPVPVAQDHLATIRRAVGAVLRRHGFRADSKRTWRRGDDVEGWVVVGWQGDKWNTRALALFAPLYADATPRASSGPWPRYPLWSR